MLEPHAGKPAPRMAETPSGMLSATGMQGPGVDVFLQRDLPWLLARGGRAIVSIAGSSPGEFGEDRKSTRLNSSHVSISYAVFCLKKKRKGARNKWPECGG